MNCFVGSSVFCSEKIILSGGEFLGHELNAFCPQSILMIFNSHNLMLKTDTQRAIYTKQNPFDTIPAT